MAGYGNLVITNDGVNLYAKVQGGTALAFTRMQIGSGTFATSSTLSTALASGTAYTSISVAALSGPVPSGSTIVIGTGTTQTVTTSADAATSATTISVNSFTANAAYATSTALAITPNEAGVTALITPVDYFPITKIVDNSGTANVRGLYQNTNLSSSTYTSELGLFATDPDLGEILYAYTNAGATGGDTFPAYATGPFSRLYQLNIAIGNATSVTATIPSVTYVTTSDVGATDGVAGLDANALILSANIPPATTSALGGVKQGTGVSIASDGTISATTTLPTDMAKTDANNNFTSSQTFGAGWDLPSGQTATVEGDLKPGVGGTIQATESNDSAQLGGVPAADFFRTDSGAPNPQVVSNPAQFPAIITKQIEILDSSGNVVGYLFGTSGGGWYFADKSNSASTLSMTDAGDMTTEGGITAGGSIVTSSVSASGNEISWTSSSQNIGGSASVVYTLTGLNANAKSFSLSVGTNQSAQPNVGLAVGTSSTYQAYNSSSSGLQISAASLSNGTLSITINNTSSTSFTGVTLTVGGMIL